MKGAEVFLISSFYLLLWVKIKQSHGPSVQKIRIGTRKSNLALVQTNHIATLLREKFPHLEIEIVDPLETIGDKVLGEHLKHLSIKTPGLFTKGLEAGLLADNFDIVVHSLKDMPTTLPHQLCLAAITEREDPRDVVVFRKNLMTDYSCSARNILNLPDGSRIGTSSVRREAILKNKLYPKKYNFELIRGNVNTRLSKLDDGEYEATILAAAGLKRLGKEFEDRITQFLNPPKFLYGVSQGALGIECRKEDTQIIKYVKLACEHFETSLRCLAERSLLRTLEGGCQLPLGVATELCADVLKLQAIILDENGETFVEDKIENVVETFEQAEELGKSLALRILDHGGREILKQFKNYSHVNEDSSRNVSRPLTYGSAENPNTEMRPVSTKK